MAPAIWTLVGALAAPGPAGSTTTTLWADNAQESGPPAAGEVEPAAAETTNAAGAEAPPTPAALTRAAAALLAHASYRFCHDPHYRIRDRDVPLCVYAPAARARCPELGPSCERGPAGAVEPAPPDGGWLYLLLEPLTVLARLLLYVVGAALAATLAYAAFHAARRYFAARAMAAPRAPASRTDPAVALTARGASSAALFAAARAAADRGDYERAVGDAYAGLLRHLHERGDLELHASRTHGDYLRSVRRHAELYPALCALTGDVDRVQFGGGRATPAVFDRVWTQVQATARGVLVLGLLFAAGAGGCERAGRYVHDLVEHGPGGFSLFTDLVARTGAEVRRRVQRLDALSADIGTLVVLAPLSPDEWGRILDWLTSGKQLVVAVDPGDAAERLGARPRPAPDDSGTCNAGVVLGEGPDPGAAGNVTLVAARGASLALTADDFTVIDGCDGPHLAWRRLAEGGTVVFLPGPRTVTNAALAAGDNAAVVIYLLWPFGGRVELVGEWTGTGAGSPYESVANARLTPALLQLALLVVVLVLWRTPFGATRDPPRARRRSFVEHVRALGAQYARAGAAEQALGAYGAWALERLRRRLRVVERGRTEPLLAALTTSLGRDARRFAPVLARTQEAVARSGAAGAPASSTAGRILAAVAGPAPSRPLPPPSFDLAAMRELGRLLVKLGGNE